MERNLLIAAVAAVCALLPCNIDAQGIYPLYKIHSTPNTRTITVQGGMKTIGYFNCGVAICVPNKGNSFVIDKQGNNLFEIPSDLSIAYHGIAEAPMYFSNDRIVLIQKSKPYGRRTALIVDKSGNIVKRFERVNNASQFVDGIAFISLNKDIDKVHKGARGAQYTYKTTITESFYMDVNGNVLSQTLPCYDDVYRGGYLIFPLKEGLRRFYDEDKKAWGYCDAKCNIVIPAKYKKVRDFNDGLAAALNDNDNWGYINNQGQFVINPIYSIEPGSFCQGVAEVKERSGRLHYINKQGQIVWSASTDNEDYNNIYRSFGPKGYTLWTLSNKTYIVNTQFQKVATVEFDLFDDSSKNVRYYDNYMLYDNRYDKLLLDYKGMPLLRYKGTLFSDGYAIGKSEDGKTPYYFNDKGEITIQFKDSQF